MVSSSTEPSIALILPISVPAPVATTRPAPWPEVASVPENAMPARSPRGASAATASVDFSRRHRLASEHGLVDLECIGPHQAQVGWHPVTGLDQAEVTRDEPLGGDADPAAVTEDRGL